MEYQLRSNDSDAILKALELTDSEKIGFLPTDEIIGEYVKRTNVDAKTVQNYMEYFIKCYDVCVCQCGMCNNGKINYATFLKWASTNNNLGQARLYG